MRRSTFIRLVSYTAFSLAGAKLLASCGGNSSQSQGAVDGGSQEQLSELNFGIISTESQANQQTVWEPFIEAMSAELGIPVNAFYVNEYAAVIEAMANGQVDVAWYGGKSYIEAAKRANAEAFAQTVADDGSTGYFSHLITNVDNPIAAEVGDGNGDRYILENAANITFAFNDPNSTSGFLVPSYYIFAQNGVDPQQAFDELIFSGSHEATALAVANDRLDVATNNNESLQRLETTNPEAREKIAVIWTSPEIPSDPIAYRKDLPENVKEQLREFFYTYDDESILSPLQWSGFREADDSRWNPIRELDIAKRMEEVKNNENLSAEQKQEQLQELEKELEQVKGS